MSILIKGAKMPKNCFECLTTLGLFSKTCPISEDSNIDVELAKNHIYDGCPLVEIPPHGRLIDADELIKNCEIWKETEIQDEHDDVWNRGIDACINEVKHHAPTVIESEEEQENE